MQTIHLVRKLDPAEWSGTETALERLLEGLRNLGVSSTVYCPRLRGRAHGVPDPLTKAGHSVRRFRTVVPILGISAERKRQLIAVGGNIASFDLFPALLRETGASIIHSHTLGRLGAIARTAARKRRIPLVLTIHGGLLDLPTQVKESFYSGNRSGWEWGRIFGLIFRTPRLFQDADAVLTCNAREASLLRELHPGKRVLVQPHGVHIAKYRKDCRGAALEAFPQMQNRSLLLCLGRLDPIKNQAWLLDQAPRILRDHPEILLVFAGPSTDEPYSKELRRKIVDRGLAEKVLLTGGFPSDDPCLVGMLQQAEALVLPSLSETFGLVILEAWAAGTPVISSRTSGACALVRHRENGWLFDLDDSQGFRNALNEALGNRTRARKMAEAGAQMVEAEYSVDALAARLKGLYQDLIERSHALRNHQG